MNFLRRLLRLALLASIVTGALKLIQMFRQPETLPSMPSAGGESGISESRRYDESELGGTVSQELLDILVCPLDKGPLELSADGKWLINRRNGYRYPIKDGIPIMLIEEGEKYKDPSLITQPPATSVA